MKAFITFALLFTSIFTANVSYKTCDPQWGEDSLWVNSVKGTNYTFCNDGEAEGQITYFNAKLLTLTADGLVARGIKCGEEECTPGTLNHLLVTLGKQGAVDALGLQSADGLSPEASIEDKLDTYILINSKVIDNITHFYVIDSVDSNGINVFDHFGNALTVQKSEITQEYMGWVVPSSLFLQ